MSTETPVPERARLDVDIVCVGFGPATAGFLAALTKQLVNPDGTPAVESAVMPGLPPQILCYERADDIGFGVSGVVTGARGLRATFPDLDRSGIPMAAPVTQEKVLYLLDPIGASRRSAVLRAADKAMRLLKGILPLRHEALELPWTPAFLHKQGGMVLSLGQFMQWVGAQIQGTGTVQIWPGTPVSQALIQNDKVVGVRLVDQGVDKQGRPGDGFLPGMDIGAALTVVGDGPVGPIGQQLDAQFGLPPGHHIRDWAAGMKFVVDLPESTPLEPGTVLHTFGYPEPEIFGFFYVHPDRVASLGIFVPSWFDSPMRTAYRYLQHWMLHPYLWRFLEGAKLRSWGAKTLGESGRRGEPRLVGDGYVRIGEGSGSTNVLTGSGVDEAWVTGTLLAEAVIELFKAKRPFTKANLEDTYVKRRRASWIEREALIAEKSRDGFQRGVVRGMVGMALAGLTSGRFSLDGDPVPPWKRIPTIEAYYSGRVVTGGDRSIARGDPRQGRVLACGLDGESRLAAHPARWSAADLASGRAADGRQSPSAGWLRGSRGFSLSRVVRPVRHQDLHRGLLWPGHHFRSRRDADVRPGEVCPLRRLLLELRPVCSRRPRPHEHRLPRRHGRPSFRRELTVAEDAAAAQRLSGLAW